MLETGLITIVVLVLILPLLVRRLEENLEAFLFAAGLAAVAWTGWFGSVRLITPALVRETLIEPVKISLVVLTTGLVFNRIRGVFGVRVAELEKKTGPHLFSFALVTCLGLVSSLISAIIAALLLVEIVNSLGLDRKFEIRLTIVACFSIGLGAALTPVGEPLSTIAIAKLAGAPYRAGFFFLLSSLGGRVIPGIFLLGCLAAFLRSRESRERLHAAGRCESKGHAFVRAGKVYIFVMALLLLGAGLKPVIYRYVAKLAADALYWINTVSAVLDNATLTAAEISPAMTILQIKAVLLGLLLAGGMLIPGNIPNIIAAHRLKIRSREWAVFGVPLGIVLMSLYFAAFIVFK